LVERVARLEREQEEARVCNEVERRMEYLKEWGTVNEQYGI
jgi:hypothetical protein